MSIVTKSVEILLPRPLVTTLLASLFGLAFIASPYWLMAEAFEVRILLLALTLAIGASWSHLSASNLRVRFDAKSWILFGVVGESRFRVLVQPVLALLAGLGIIPSVSQK